MLPTKSALRAEMLARLRALSPDERHERSLDLVVRLSGREDWQRARVVGLFAPLRSEPDLDLLWTLPAALTGKVVVYPRVEHGGMVLRVVSHPGELFASGRLREPPATAPTLRTHWPDLLLVPGLAFTTAGRRLGRGGGHYDRLLAAPGRGGSRLLGIAFGLQLVPGLPHEEHDVDLDEVVTDSFCGD